MSRLCLMENVHKTFRMGEDSVEVLKGVNLAVERGEIAAIMGASGSGKSTLMNLIGCLDVPTSGRYLFADREVLGLTDDALSELRNSRIGFVFQSFYLLPYATVLENVLLPSLYRESAKDGARERALELLRLVGLEGRMRFRPNRLSGGEQQRVAICRALMNDPDLALLGHETMHELFGEENPVGKTILVRQIPVQVVGVLQERGAAQGGGNIDNRVVMPLTTVMRKLQNEAKYISFLRIRFADQDNLERRVEEIKSFLRVRHRIPDGESDDFQIFSSKDIIKFLVALTGSLVAFVGIVGIISLIVAGFVLANLFHLSVRERTGEIGIRRSIGAKRRDILFQFLGEALIITTMGGICGFILGIATATLLKYVEDFPIHFSWKAFAIGLLLSWIVGIVFGLRPASQAANLEPIEAIRGGL